MTSTETQSRSGAEVVCAGLVHVYPSEQGPVAALRNVDLVVEAGEMLAIVGPSGSGKTTLMLLLSGLLQPTAGSVLIGGQDITQLDAPSLSRLRATELSLLLQDPMRNLLPYATVTQNVSFASRGARRRGWPLRWSSEDLVERWVWPSSPTGPCTDCRPDSRTERRSPVRWRPRRACCWPTSRQGSSILTAATW